MIRLAFSTNAFKKNTLTEAVESIADIGYAGVEIMADLPHALPATFTQAQVDQLRALLSRRGLAVSNINAFTLFACGDTYHPTWIEDDLSLAKNRIVHTQGAIRLAKALGASTVSLQPGGPLIGTSLTPDAAMERFADNLLHVLPAAKAAGIVLAIEPEPGLLIQTAAEYRLFKNRYFQDEPLVAMNCDVGHLYCVGDDPARVIRDMPDQIAHVHLEDIGDNRVHQHLTPGKGAIDFSAIFRSLETIKYPGWVTVELYPYEAGAAGVARMAYDHLVTLIAGSSAHSAK